MQNLVSPSGRCVLRHRGVPPSENERDLTSEELFVEPERGLALTVKTETNTGIQCHLASIAVGAAFDLPERPRSYSQSSLADGSVYWKNGSSSEIHAVGVQPASDFHSRIICAWLW